MFGEFAEYWQLNGDKILSLFREGKYKPSAVLLEEMVFKTGKKIVGTCAGEPDESGIQQCIYDGV